MNIIAADLLVHRVPPEIWLQILSLVARPTADQMTCSIDTYDRLSTEGYSLNTYMNQEEESELIAQRSTLVMVCKTWYPIANALLWSHVRLILSSPTRPLKGMRKTILHSPQLAGLIKRLTIREVLESSLAQQKYEWSNELDLWELMDCLTSLRMIVYPSAYRLADQLAGVQIALVYNSNTCIRSVVQGFSGYDISFQQLRMLAIAWDTSAIALERTSFPMLEMVHIYLPPISAAATA